MTSPTASLVAFFDPADQIDNGLSDIMKTEFFALACKIEDILPGGPEKTTAIRKLLEARDTAIRACR